MDRHIVVVGVDHGWSGMKTVSQVFTTGVKEITTEPAFYNNVVEFNGSYYKVGGKRLEVRDLKVENDNFYILTLAAVAKELNRRGMRNANILLSVGLPLTRFGAEKQDFIDYLSKEKEVTFRFDNEQYRIKLARVSVFPQCYAAVADRMKTLPKRVVVVDIGSWTIDIMPIEDSAPNEAECITIREGLIKCMRTINEECMRQYGNVRENVRKSIAETEHTINKLDAFGSGMREAGQKIANTFRTFADKETIDYSEKEKKFSKTELVKKTFEAKKKLFQRMEQHLDEALDKVESLAKEPERMKDVEMAEPSMLGAVAEPEFQYGAEVFEAYQKMQGDKSVNNKLDNSIKRAEMSR